MHLTKGEERILGGEEGETRRRAMELLVALGDISKAEGLVPIVSAQVAGASFKTISEAGVEFLEELSADAKVTVKSTLNPLGMDREGWRDLGIDEEFAKMQMRILRAYDKMGIELTCTCTPYFVGNRPGSNEHIAWAESSAVVFANSVLGARTNKEGGPSALAAAIIGKTPNCGLQIEENRQPKVEVRVGFEPSFDDFSILGYVIGKSVGQKIPLITGISPAEDEHKAIGAAMAASGAVSMYRFAKDREECSQFDTMEETISVEREQLNEAREHLNSSDSKPDIVTIGCPHLSVSEMKWIAWFLRGRQPRKDFQTWFCVSRKIANQCPNETAVMRRFGKIACDTCMVVAPIEKLSRSVATDSSKAAVYLPTLCDQKVLFRSRKELLEMISK